MKTIMHNTAKGDYKIEIHCDEDARNPREDMDNLGTMAYKHSRYKLGDEEVSSPQEFLVNLTNGELDEDADETAIQEYLDEHYVMLPLYLYDHSGITMNTTGFSCPWDSGQVGYIYVSKEDVCKNWNCKDWNDEVPYGDDKKITAKEYAKKILESEVAIFDDYISGEVYGYEVYRPDEDDSFNSCWGYYGNDHKKSGLMEAAIGAIESDL